MTNRQGTCIISTYIDTLNKFKHMQDIVIIVHGYVYTTNNKSDKSRRLIKHAWIEFINDPELNNTLYDSVLEEFRDKDKARKELGYKEIKRYTINELAILSLRTNSKGGNFEF